MAFFNIIVETILILYIAIFLFCFPFASPVLRTRYNIASAITLHHLVVCIVPVPAFEFSAMIYALSII